ncbi:hypothetical protein FRAAL4274 [Frankia alni ACN14a]|uniref:Uncharacterized protein n=1 Tax=Frankia alni (strain DSM 45986 / CECT 9034 / ACN14a) TaxID=326424 RepID=Q0RHV7_FRAAA|nr:hypothetical protein FRAAL4274 [Frankia alni ACN14a]
MHRCGWCVHADAADRVGDRGPTATVITCATCPATVDAGIANGQALPRAELCGGVELCGGAELRREAEPGRRPSRAPLSA